MEFKIERKVSFVETGYIEAESSEDLIKKLKTATLNWDVDFEYDPTIESIEAYDENGEEIDEVIPADIMEEDWVEAQNGCIIFNREEFENYI